MEGRRPAIAEPARETSYRAVAARSIEYEHQIVARTSRTDRPTRWDIERPRGSGLRQDFLADSRPTRLRRQRDVLMLPGDQDRSIAR